jgi:molybdopterin-guanine dinucleotide biosynthesis protein B
MIVGVAGFQNSGKTRLVELIIPRIIQGGFSVVSVKHIAHDDLAVDAAGTDTFRHKRAGSRVAVAVSDQETVYFHARAQTLDQILARLKELEPADLILVEGFKASALPKIVIGEVEHGGPALWRWDGTEAGAAHIAQSLMAGIRAERAGLRRTGARRPRGRGRASSPPSRNRRRAGRRAALRR